MPFFLFISSFSFTAPNTPFGMKLSCHFIAHLFACQIILLGTKCEATVLNPFCNQNQVFKYASNLKAPFPDWLSRFTGLTDWPDETVDPPYIPLDFIDSKKIPYYPRRGKDNCNITRDGCSFDCYHCIKPDEIMGCSKMSQTFDDGPSPGTEQLLDHITHNTTFFTVGTQIVNWPAIFVRTVKEGHLVGSHTWSHKFLPSLSNEDIIAQIEWSVWAMNATAGVIPKYFRPPYGGLDDRVRAITGMFGMTNVLWDHDSFDWKLFGGEMNKDEIVNNVLGWNHSSGLILEHDVLCSSAQMGVYISKILGDDQYTVAECVSGRRYMNIV